MNVTVSWTLTGGDSPDFYFINITTNDPDPPYGGLLYITAASVRLTGFQAGYEYTITVHGVNCGSQEGGESEPLTITPEGRHTSNLYYPLSMITESVYSIVRDSVDTQ